MPVTVGRTFKLKCNFMSLYRDDNVNGPFLEIKLKDHVFSTTDQQLLSLEGKHYLVRQSTFRGRRSQAVMDPLKWPCRNLGSIMTEISLYRTIEPISEAASRQLTSTGTLASSVRIWPINTQSLSSFLEQEAPLWIAPARHRSKRGQEFRPSKGISVENYDNGPCIIRFALWVAEEMMINDTRGCNMLRSPIVSGDDYLPRSASVRWCDVAIVT